MELMHSALQYIPPINGDGGSVADPVGPRQVLLQSSQLVWERFHEGNDVDLYGTRGHNLTTHPNTKLLLAVRGWCEEESVGIGPSHWAF